MKNITINRRDFIAKIGGVSAFSAMSSDAIADEIEHQLEQKMAESEKNKSGQSRSNSRRRHSGDYRRGSGRLFRVEGELPPMPAKPTLIDFFKNQPLF